MSKGRTLQTNAAIQNAIRLYFDGKTTECFDLLDSLHLDEPTGTEKSRLKKTVLLLLVGELFGLHTLRQILDAHAIKSNNWAKVYARISATLPSSSPSARCCWGWSSRFRLRGTVEPVLGTFKGLAHHPHLCAQEKPFIPQWQLFGQFSVVH
jgi:hypothetical protein